MTNISEPVSGQAPPGVHLRAQQLDRASPVPVYHQLKTLLLERILSGELGPGDRVPTEEELCESYAVSRTPVRQALGELASEGIIVRRRRHGSFVAAKLPSELVGRYLPPLRIVLSDGRWKPYVEHAIASSPLPLSAEISFEPLPRLHDALISAAARGIAPDLAIVDSVWVPELARSGFLYSLDELDATWTEECRRDFLPPFVAANSRDGHLYAVQTEADVTLLWYRKDWFEEDGIDPPSTWTELEDAASHFLKTRPAMTAPLGLPAGPGAGETSTYVLSALLQANGADIISYGKVVLASPQAAEVMEFLAGLTRDGLLPDRIVEFGWDELSRRFGAGEFALVLGGSYERSFILEESGWDEEARRRCLGFVPVPSGPRGRPATTAGGMACGIFRQTSRPADALAVVKRMVAPDLLMEFNRSTDQVPPRRSIVERLDPRSDPFLVYSARLAEQARTRPSIPEYARVSAQLQSMIVEVLSGRRQPTEAVTRTAELISAITGLPLLSDTQVRPSRPL